MYNHPVMTLFVLGDEDEEWRPKEYVYEEAGCRRTLSFPTVKLLDYANRLDELEVHENPFGMMVVAHLTAQRTRSDVEARKAVKLRLLKGLYARGMDEVDSREWAKYIDWLLELPAKYNQEIWQEVYAIEKEKQMPFVTSFEKIGYERGRAEGLEEGLLTAIELALPIKFGADGRAVIQEVRKQKDIAVLRSVCEAIENALSIDDIRHCFLDPKAWLC